MQQTSTPTDNKTKTDNVLVNKNHQHVKNEQPLPLAKRLFMSPIRKVIATATTPITSPPPIVEAKRPLTPLNRIRGLFSVYRDRKDVSTSSSESESPNCSNFNDTDNLNISLINVSPAD